MPFRVTNDGEPVFNVRWHCRIDALRTSVLPQVDPASPEKVFHDIAIQSLIIEIPRLDRNDSTDMNCAEVPDLYDDFLRQEQLDYMRFTINVKYSFFPSPKWFGDNVTRTFKTEMGPDNQLKWLYAGPKREVGPLNPHP